MKQTGIYAIHSPSGKMYVGSAVNIEQRWINHRARLKAGRHPSYRLTKAWQKYDGKGFKFVVLEDCEPDQLLVREQHWIDLLQPAYNIRTIAESNFGVPTSKAQKAAASEVGKRPETLARLHAATKASWADPKRKAARIAGLRAAWTDEKRAAVSAKQKGVDKGQAAREARWSAPGASERASEALSKAWQSRLPRTEQKLREMVEASGWVCEAMTGVKASDRVMIFCVRHDYRKDVGVSNLQRGQGCRFCGFERSSAKQKGVSVSQRNWRAP